MENKQISTERGNIAYWMARIENKDAETIIFLHGLTANHTLFDKQMVYFKERYHLLCWDAPAHGESRPYKDFTYENVADDLKRILDIEHIQKVILVGQSMGGYVAQAFLKKYANRVKGFIGIDTCPFGLAYYSKSDRWWLRQVEWMSMCYPHKMLKRVIAKSSTYTKEAYQNMHLALQHYSKRELCHLMGIGYGGFLKENCDLEITCPVLILVGEHDHTGKVQQYCRAWHQKTSYPLHMIKNAAHNSNVDNSEAVNQEIECFIQSIVGEKGI